MFDVYHEGLILAQSQMGGGYFCLWCVVEEFGVIYSREHFGENLCCVGGRCGTSLFGAVFKCFCSVETFGLRLGAGMCGGLPPMQVRTMTGPRGEDYRFHE
jgi:hypothetical protein